MNIQSFLIKQEGQVQYMLLDVVAESRHYFAGLGLGTFEHLTETSQNVLDRLASYAFSPETDNGEVHLVELTSIEKARERIPRVLMVAKPGDRIFFICKDSKIYDVVFSLLRLQKHNRSFATSH